MKKHQSKTSTSKAVSKPSDAASTSYRILGGRITFLKYSRLAWNNYLKHQLAFAKVSSRFTVKLGEDELQALKKLEKTLQASDLSSIRADYYEDMESLKLSVKLGVWYIKEAFLDSDKKLAELGLTDISNYNFSREKATKIATSLKTFITKSRKELEVNDNMPASFPQEFNEVANKFLQSLQKITKAESNISDTGKYLESLFEERKVVLAKMLKVATDVVFFNNEEVRNMFNLNNLISLARIGDKTYLIGVVRLANKKPVKKAAVTIPGYPTLSAITDTDGRFKIELEAGGTYQVKVKAPGFLTTTVTKAVTDGARSQITIYMTPLEQPTTKLPQPKSVPTNRSKSVANSL